MPALTAEGQARADARAAARKKKGPADDPEDRNLAERCLIGFNAGPPFTPSAYNNNVQIVQTRDYVVILNEMVHDARIVPLDGRPHLPRVSDAGRATRAAAGRAIRSWWRRRTSATRTSLVGASENLKLTERFRRDGTRHADVRVHRRRSGHVDEALDRTRSACSASPSRSIEYACHEANYGMEGILKGTRAEERLAGERKPSR